MGTITVIHVLCHDIAYYKIVAGGLKLFCIVFRNFKKKITCSHDTVVSDVSMLA